MHWDLLAGRASNFENPNVLILEHDLVTNGIDFGGVWGALSMMLPLSESVVQSTHTLDLATPALYFAHSGTYVSLTTTLT